MRLIIHRGAHQVGGTCVELNCGDSTILIDVGLPLEYNFGDDLKDNLPQPLFRELEGGRKRVDGVLLSHAHLDHYGLAGMLPREIPVYCGKASADLIDISNKVGPGTAHLFKPRHFKAGKTFQIGAFSITPYLMDHSAFDAYAFLVSAGDGSLFYTGDFRGHGRKAELFKHEVKNLPHADVLLMEGTTIGPRSDEVFPSEEDLEKSLLKIIEETPGIVLITTSSQNIDRLVTIFKATKLSERRFIIDFYTAEILMILGKYARLPQASWPRIRVCYPQLLARRFEKIDLNKILKRHQKNGIRWTRIREIESEAVMLIRPGFLFDIKKFLDLSEATWVYSMWPGYFEKSKPLKSLKAYLEEKNVRIEYLHTSGHPRLSDMTKLVGAVKPQMIIPIHSFHAEKFKDHFPNMRLVHDGEVVQL